MLKLFLTSAKSNDITNVFVNSILLQKIAFTSMYDITLSPEHFEIKNKDLRPLYLVKNRQLLTVPLNFDCSRVWQ